GLSHSSILSLVMDREGCLWVGTNGGGLNRVKRQVFEVLEPTRGFTMQTACEDSQGGLWFGFFEGHLTFLNGGATTNFGIEQGLQGVRSVFADRDHGIWVGTEGSWLRGSLLGLFRFKEGRFEPATGSEMLRPPISAIYQDRAGLVWVGTQAGLARWDGNRW